MLAGGYSEASESYNSMTRTMIAIKIKHSTMRGVASRPAGVGWFGSFESELLHVELLSQRITTRHL
jgi:hypothetical protein